MEIKLDWPLCECGCGRPAKAADKTRPDRGWIKGEPLRFATQACAARVVGKLGGQPGGDKHPSWKGEKVGYFALHEWLREKHPHKHICEFCGTAGTTHYACVGEYSRDIDDYVELCVSCHFKLDKLVKRLLDKVELRRKYGWI